MAESSPSETSPLLASTNGTPSNGTIPDHHVESGVPEENRKEPLPGVQAQLKYIVPAISVGVCLYPLYFCDITGD